MTRVLEPDADRELIEQQVREIVERVKDELHHRPQPCSILFWAIMSTAIIGTVVAVYGFGLMTPIGWAWAGAIWLYAACWFIFNDSVKVAVLRYYRHKKGIEVL
ncbi:hypothetical protein [Sulfurivirga caldicuralii]|uniref:hypothetical protein n=1 Tax=Sulfurivirga caldicuralii TaxID=364032 RepID=UPI000940B960|nr:hypothetical protein [Sulfurivirga caldicuralii]